MKPYDHQSKIEMIQGYIDLSLQTENNIIDSGQIDEARDCTDLEQQELEFPS